MLAFTADRIGQSLSKRCAKLASKASSEIVGCQNRSVLTPIRQSLFRVLRSVISVDRISPYASPVGDFELPRWAQSGGWAHVRNGRIVLKNSFVARRCCGQDCRRVVALR